MMQNHQSDGQRAPTIQRRKIGGLLYGGVRHQSAGSSDIAIRPGVSRRRLLSSRDGDAEQNLCQSGTQRPVAELSPKNKYFSTTAHRFQRDRGLQHVERCREMVATAAKAALIAQEF